MSAFQLLLRNLSFYWRTNLAVILGVIAATAVIGGALVVGDSVRDSLREMSLVRLGDIDHAVSGQRFFREELAESNQAPALVMQGTLEFEEEPSEEEAARGEEPALHRAGHINVYGVDERFWKLLDSQGAKNPDTGEIVLNRRVADQLKVNVGDDVSLIVEIPASIPRDALLGDREETVTELVATVSSISEDATGISRFGLNPSQQLPLNAFVNLGELQQVTGLAEVRRSKRNPIPKPARVNALFVNDPDGDISVERAQALTDELADRMTLADLALRINTNEEHGYLSLESEQMILENSLSKTALNVAEDMNAVTSPVLVYLLNEMHSASNPDNYSMYSVIAGIGPERPAPFGPFEFTGDHQLLTGNNVYINDWLAKDLEVAVDDKIDVKYHVVGDRGELPEDEKQLTVAGIVKLEGPAEDPGLTPTVPGVTDADSYADWREPFPLKRDMITGRDDAYWEDYRTTPKIFMALDRAQELWRSKYGELTSVRFAPAEDSSQTLTELEEQFTQKFLDRLAPVQTGIIVQPIKQIGLSAAQGTTDFTGLFIGFSFFLILAATILVSLLFRLGIEQRTSEFGLLSAVGLPPKSVRRLFLVEGVILVTIGGFLGLLAAVGYADVMIYGLKTWWIGAIGTKFLFLSIKPLSLIAGFAIASIVALLAVYFAIRNTRSFTTRELLAGDLTLSAKTSQRQSHTSTWLALLSGAGSLLLLVLTLVGIIPDSEAFSGFSWRTVMFFVIGMGMLTASLTALAAILSSNRALPVKGGKAAATRSLGLRNASRNGSRSVMTASLIASAAFVIVAVAAGQQNPTQAEPKNQSANGGFTLVAETNVPILNDLNTVEGRSKLGFNVLDEEENQLFKDVYTAPFRVRPGENASCLNLYQTQLPTVLGVPDDVLDEFVENNRFTFADTPSDQPWSVLREDLESGNIPVLGDLNTLQYSLHKGIGDTVDVPNSDAKLEVRGMFNNSIFQGVLVMSEANFEQLFPEQVGFQYFLIQIGQRAQGTNNAPEEAAAISEVLESNLGDYGFDADRVADRLANFLSVQNTYLSTFQTLGGLGLLLGTIGLATVMLRNVLERRGELSLLRAVGFPKQQVAKLIAWENVFLLFWGLASGTVSALLAMSPHLVSTSSALPVISLAILLGSVFLIGMLASTFAVRAAVNTPILTTLRGE